MRPSISASIHSPPHSKRQTNTRVSSVGFLQHTSCSNRFGPLNITSSHSSLSAGRENVGYSVLLSPSSCPKRSGFQDTLGWEEHFSSLLTFCSRWSTAHNSLWFYVSLSLLATLALPSCPSFKIISKCATTTSVELFCLNSLVDLEILPFGREVKGWWCFWGRGFGGFQRKFVAMVFWWVENPEQTTVLKFNQGHVF